MTTERNNTTVAKLQGDIDTYNIRIEELENKIRNILDCSDQYVAMWRKIGEYKDYIRDIKMVIKSLS